MAEKKTLVPGTYWIEVLAVVDTAAEEAELEQAIEKALLGVRGIPRVERPNCALAYPSTPPELDHSVYMALTDEEAAERLRALCEAEGGSGTALWNPARGILFAKQDWGNRTELVTCHSAWLEKVRGRYAPYEEQSWSWVDQLLSTESVGMSREQLDDECWREAVIGKALYILGKQPEGWVEVLAFREGPEPGQVELEDLERMLA